jgi:hypothetical protein
VRQLAEGHEHIDQGGFHQFRAVGELGSGLYRRRGSDLADGLCVAEVHKLLMQMTHVLTEFRGGDRACDVPGGPANRDLLSPAELGHLRAIAFQLDQCWDLLDQLETRLATRRNGLGNANRSGGHIS